MKFQVPTHFGFLLKRYKRFLADIKLNSGEIITAHLANTGSMKSCLGEDWRALLTYHDSPKRKLKYSLEMLHNGDSWIGVNTSRANDIVHEALLQKKIPELSHYQEIKKEYKVGKSRIDFYLNESSHKLPEYFLEVKSVTLKAEPNFALFPDSVSERGQKHLQELIELKKNNYGAGIFFLVQREDVDIFKPASSIDPTYAKLLQKAKDKGVDIFVYQCELNESCISVKKSIPYEI